MLYILNFLFFYLLFICGSGYEFPSKDPKSPTVFRLLDPKTMDHMKREDDFNALNDYRGSSNQGPDVPYKNAFFEEDEPNKFRDHRKKSDSRPKYDPGWKFIGLGKRPEIDDEFRYAPQMGDGNGGVNPLLGISTLINFEFFNAIKDGIEDVAKGTVKKEDSMRSPSGVADDESGSMRHNKLNWFSGRQKSMYDPGWMLTGLGK